MSTNTEPEPAPEQLANVFEERAEYLSEGELRDWTTLTTRDKHTIEKLVGPGAKLLIGPRGSGKSTLLRSAYYRLLSTKEALPAYINYANSLALEPLFHRNANALQIFRQWLLLKIVVGIAKSFEEAGRPQPDDLRSLSAYGGTVIEDLAAGSSPESFERLLSPTTVAECLERWAHEFGARRCVLLMDDAAHAFSPEQQREFFEVFRELRSRRVAGKAAVYPGITSYSPHFQVGHEAEVLEAWYQPDEPGYLTSMRSLVQKRLPSDLAARLADRQELVDYLALASFGLPRGFLNMLSQLFGLDEDGSGRPTRQRADQSVADHADSVRAIFMALRAKVPRFTHFVEVGAELERAIIQTLRKYNALQNDLGKRATIVALEQPLGVSLERMLNMLEYAGVVRKLSSVSRGVKGSFQRYALHSAIVLKENALSLGRSFSVADAIRGLQSRDAHAFARTKGTVLLGPHYEERCVLDLPPCPNCGTARVSEEQRFCMKCGQELHNASVYEELLQTPIDVLPLPARKREGIKQHTSLRTVQDLLLDDDQHLLTVPYIGPIWSARIRTVAQEFVSV